MTNIVWCLCENAECKYYAQQVQGNPVFQYSVESAGMSATPSRYDCPECGMEARPVTK